MENKFKELVPIEEKENNDFFDELEEAEEVEVSKAELLQNAFETWIEGLDEDVDLNEMENEKIEESENDFEYPEKEETSDEFRECQRMSYTFDEWIGDLDNEEAKLSFEEMPSEDRTIDLGIHESEIDGRYRDKVPEGNENSSERCPIEGKQGHWEGERGNSNWYPNRDYVPAQKSESGYNNPDNKTWGDILDIYGVEYIPFKEGEPIFDAVSKGDVKITGFSDNRNSNFAKADIELAKQKGCTPEEVKAWRKENGYTWHEKSDMETMQKVPHEIHANIPHCGGIAAKKKGE